MEKPSLKRQIVEKGIQQLLEEAKVPHKIHMRVLSALSKRMDEHKEDIESWHKLLGMHLRAFAKHKKRDAEHTEQVKGFQGELERYKSLAKGDQGEPGDPGRDGLDAPQLEAIISSIIPHIPAPLKGQDGKDGKSGKDAEIDREELVKDIIKVIRTNRLIDAKDIKGLQGWVKDGVGYRFEELMHGAGSGGSTTNFVDNEVVSGSGTAWTLVNTPIAGSVQLYGNGQFLTPGAGNDYTISGKTITTANSFSAGTIMANYRK